MTSRHMSVLSVLLACAVLWPSTAAAQTTGEGPHSAADEADAKAGLAPVTALFAAFESGDAAAMLRQVYADGRVTASGQRADGSASLRQQSWTQFAERVRPDRAFQERISDPKIAVDGDIAMIWAPFVV